MTIEQFIPRFDIRERHGIMVRAPAALVLEVARTFDLQSIPLVRAIFWLRSKLLRSATMERKAIRLVAETTALGWGVLSVVPDRLIVLGARTQPWQPNPTFIPIPADQFAAFAEPDQVKIVWTLEVEPLGESVTRFSSETRAVATDELAREKFHRYWRLVGLGVVLIRRLVAPAIRRQAERRYGAMKLDRSTNSARPIPITHPK